MKAHFQCYILTKKHEEKHQKFLKSFLIHSSQLNVAVVVPVSLGHGATRLMTVCSVSVQGIWKTIGKIRKLQREKVYLCKKICI